MYLHIHTECMCMLHFLSLLDGIPGHTINHDQSRFIFQDDWKGITSDVSGKGHWGFTKRQIYFDFVPPSLNNFEYFMTKLLNIEKSLYHHYPMKSLKPTLSRYMSFTFVFGNHLDVKQASLALFDAEPGKLC